MQSTRQGIGIQAAAFAVTLGGESQFSADYYARVTGVSASEDRLTVKFDAIGKSDLNDPASSCLHVHNDAGDFQLKVIGMILATSVPGHYAGDLVFPLVLPGTYQFQYSCAQGYSTTSVGTASLSIIGVSSYDNDPTTYFAVVLGESKTASGTTIQFAAHGPADLRAPDSSCLEAAGTSVPPTVDVVDQGSQTGSKYYYGSMTFPGVAGGAFRYSCQSNYSAVQL